MKTKKAISILTVLFILFANLIISQDSTKMQVKIKTSAVCETCKKKIEQALVFEKGVKFSDLNLETKIITVTYDAKKTSPGKIKLAISNAGYDADEVKANPKAYKKLDECCKK